VIDDVLDCTRRLLLLTKGIPHDPLEARRQGGALGHLGGALGHLGGHFGHLGGSFGAKTGGVGGLKEKERWAKAADDIRQHSSWASALRDPELAVFMARAFTWARAASCLQPDITRLYLNPGF
jgi:hypothetical protein